MMHSPFWQKISFHARVAVRTAALRMLHIRTDSEVGKMVCVSSLIYRISINPGTRGRVACVRPLLPGMFMWARCLLAAWIVGLQVQACSCLAAPALQNHEWLMMPSRGGCLALAPNQFPQTVAVLSGCGISWSGAWLGDRNGSKGAVKRRGKMEVHLCSDEAVSLHW